MKKTEVHKNMSSIREDGSDDTKANDSGTMKQKGPRKTEGSRIQRELWRENRICSPFDVALRRFPVFSAAPPEDDSGKDKFIYFLKSNWFAIATAVALILAIIIGILISVLASDSWNERKAMYFGFIGNLYLSALRSIIVPLIIPSIIVAIGAVTMKTVGNLGLGMLIYVASTTLLAVLLGICMVLIVNPGKEGGGGDEEPVNQARGQLTTVDRLLDVIRNIVPSNVFQATMQSYQTKLTPDKNNSTDKLDWKIGHEMIDSMNMVGLIAWFIGFSIALTACGPKGTPVVDFFVSIIDTIMVMTMWVVTLTPVGVFFLVVESLTRMPDIWVGFKMVGLYFTTVVVGILLYGSVVLPLIYFLLVRKNPYTYIGNLTGALLTAFSTASSMATLPVSIELSESKNDIDPAVSRFVLSIGATVNMNGLALYEAVATIFIAQKRGMELDFGKMLMLSLTATTTSIGAAGIPQGGLVALMVVLDSVGLDARDIGLILSVDWLLDRFMTALNILGDCIGAAILQKLVFKDADELGKLHFPADHFEGVDPENSGNGEDKVNDEDPVIVGTIGSREPSVKKEELSDIGKTANLVVLEGINEKSDS